MARALRNARAMAPDTRATIRRTASARWQNDLKAGKGSVSTESGALENIAYSFAARFASGKGTNPEELLAASHAGCFTMALAAELGRANLVAESLRTAATVTLNHADSGWSVIEVHLVVVATVPGASPELFQKAARAVKSSCAISRILDTTITLSARLEDEA